jgi:hypothetical protein
MPRVSKKIGVPLEDDEAMVFADWLRAQRIPHTHVANEIGGSTQAAKVRALKAKRMGQTAGVWDYEVFLPIYDIDGEIGSYQEVRIELKRTKGSTTSSAQKEWGKIYEMAGIPCAICKGAEKAIDFVEAIKKEINGEDIHEF